MSSADMSEPDGTPGDVSGQEGGPNNGPLMLTRDNLRRPEAESPGLGGSLYVLELDSGAVKVGMTVDADRRIREHRSAASIYGVRIGRTWVSDRVPDIRGAERDLLSALGLIFEPFGWPGRETFSGVEFEAAVFLARVACGERMAVAASAVDAEAVPREGDSLDPVQVVGDEGKRLQARSDYLKSVEIGHPLTGAELGRRYGFSERWGRRQIAAANDEMEVGGQ